MSVIFGTVLAITIGNTPFNLVHFIAAFFGMVFLHTGSNLLNDVFDFKKGIDQKRQSRQWCRSPGLDYTCPGFEGRVVLPV